MATWGSNARPCNCCLLEKKEVASTWRLICFVSGWGVCLNCFKATLKGLVNQCEQFLANCNISLVGTRHFCSIAAEASSCLHLRAVVKMHPAGQTGHAPLSRNPLQLSMLLSWFGSAVHFCVRLSHSSSAAGPAQSSPAVHVLDLFWMKSSWESFQEQVSSAMVADGCWAQDICPEPVPGEQTPSINPSSQSPEMHLVCRCGLQHQLCSVCCDPLCGTEPRCAWQIRSLQCQQRLCLLNASPTVLRDTSFLQLPAQLCWAWHKGFVNENLHIQMCRRKPSSLYLQCILLKAFVQLSNLSIWVIYALLWCMSLGVPAYLDE